MNFSNKIDNEMTEEGNDLFYHMVGLYKIPDRTVLEKSELHRVLDVMSHNVEISKLQVEEVDTYGDLLDNEIEVTMVVEPVSSITSKALERVDNEIPIQVAFLNVMGTIGLVNEAFKQTPKFHPFNRQHRILHELGPFVYVERRDVSTVKLSFDKVSVSLMFPPVGYETFTGQFKNSTGILSRDQGIISCSSVSNIIYGMRYLPRGEEFVVFEVDTPRERKFFLWTSTFIEEVVATGCSYGVQDSDTYFIMYGTGFTRKTETSRSLKLPFFYVTDDALRYAEKDLCELWGITMPIRGVLLNVNGVEYLSPTVRSVVLQNHEGRMVDAARKHYVVDIIASGSGVYEIGSPYRYLYPTTQKSDSTTVIGVVRDSAITVAQLVAGFRIPWGLMVQLDSVEVVTVYDRNTYMAVERERKIPFFCKSTGASKNAAVARFVGSFGVLPLDPIVCSDIARGYIYIGNNGYRPSEAQPIIASLNNEGRLQFYFSPSEGRTIAFRKEGKDPSYALVKWNHWMGDKEVTFTREQYIKLVEMWATPFRDNYIKNKKKKE